MDATLPRRALLGISFSSTDALSHEGIRVARIVPLSMAAEAKLETGDIIVEISGFATRTIDDLRFCAKQIATQSTATLSFLREKNRYSVEVPVLPCPRESIPNSELRYDQIVSDQSRLRTIISAPHGLSNCPAVLFIQGISCNSLDFALTPPSALQQLLYSLAQTGFATMRLEKRGVGDSDGLPSLASQTDFTSEVQDYTHALDQLISLPFVDSAGVFLLGHSVGGMIAPLLAVNRSVAGIITYGTSALPWFDCLKHSQYRQLLLRGMNQHTAEQQAIDTHLFYSSLLHTPDFHDLVDGRTAQYHCQLHTAELEKAWRKIRSPVLVTHGEYDWVVGEDEEQAIVKTVNSWGQDNAQYVNIPKMDHLFTCHQSVEQSIANYGKGSIQDTLAQSIISWLQQ